MSRIPATTRSLAQHIATGQWDPSLPKAFEITEERMSRSRTHNRTKWAQNMGMDAPDNPQLDPASTKDLEDAL
jgi:hypothetical protein